MAKEEKRNLFLSQVLVLVISLNLIICPMAKNIYSDPDLSQTSRKFDTFVIDFKGVKTPYSTYWALCNWQMDLTDFKKTHSDVSGGGAYGGLQTVINGKTAIISFWETSYTENGVSKILRANRVYPEGAESSFGGEGEGNNYIAPFDWKTNNWYRYLLHSWKDEKTGNTFVGEWFQDLETKKWTLFAYFNTNLKNSYLTGGVSMFQENYNGKYFGEERKFNIKNTYVHDISKDRWISLDTTTLSYDPASWGYDTAGTHEFGSTDEFFWGSTGLTVSDQKEYDAKNPSSLKLKITQPVLPSLFNGISISYYEIKATTKKVTFNWEISELDSPMLSYTVKITDSSKKVIHTYTSTRPEERSYTYVGSLNGKYIFELEVTDVFGETSSMSQTKTISS